MTILEFGDRSKQKLILVHGFQSPWQIWEPYIDRYKNDFHIIVPVLSGHDPDKKEDFISFAEDARTLEDHILSRYGDSVYGIFGMSMGGVLAATLWQNNRLHFRKVIFDGSPLTFQNPLMDKFMLNFYLKVTHKTQQRDPKTLQQALSICPESHMPYFIKLLDNMSDATIRNALSGISAFQLNSSIPVSGTEIYYFHGTAMNEMLAKQSAKYIQKHYPNAVIHCFHRKAHCENSIFHPEYMITELDGILLDGTEKY